MPSFKSPPLENRGKAQPHFRLWLKADIQRPEFDVRYTPRNGHSEAQAGLPVLTRLGQLPPASDTRAFNSEPFC
jgi:hypothetical protein